MRTGAMYEREKSPAYMNIDTSGMLSIVGERTQN